MEFLIEAFSSTYTKHTPWVVIDGTENWCRFVYDTKTYAVTVQPNQYESNKQEVAFGQLVEGGNPDKYDLDNYTMLNLTNNVKNALHIFNRVIYILSDFLSKNKNINDILFRGSNPQLRRLYSIIIKDKTFIKTLEKIGFEYIPRRDDYLYFKRKNKKTFKEIKENFERYR